MTALLRISAVIDWIIEKIAMIFVWSSILLMITVIYDVVTRYFGLPRGFGINATMLQESEYWFHTMLFTFTLAWAFRRQAHVRIDLIRDRLPIRVKYLIEMIGCLAFLIPYAAITFYFTLDYTEHSYMQNEVSKSGVGLTHTWIIKATIPAMFLLLGLAGVSQFIKSLAGFCGKLPSALVTETLGGDN
jgi:TRAP-type mannitol/chloroaromatic compound transport system permease small subunit